VPFQKKIDPAKRGMFQIVKEPNKLALLIPEATDRQTVLLYAVVLGRIAIAIAQDAGPGAVGTVLRRTPPVTPVTEVVNTDEITTVLAEAARKT
jgi:hypothetical protein